MYLLGPGFGVLGQVYGHMSTKVSGCDVKENTLELVRDIHSWTNNKTFKAQNVFISVFKALVRIVLYCFLCPYAEVCLFRPCIKNRSQLETPYHYYHLIVEYVEFNWCNYGHSCSKQNQLVNDTF